MRLNKETTIGRKKSERQHDEVAKLNYNTNDEKKAFFVNFSIHFYLDEHCKKNE